MRVTRITIDADLGLIELQTGPGGDGNYVLLPIDVPPTAERYLRIPGEPCDATEPEAAKVGVTYTRSPELQREFDKYLAAEKDECDGNCGAHPVKKGRDDDVWTRAPGEGAPSKERHTGPATITNPIRVFADEHSRGYRLHSPALPGWRADINRYDLHKVPGMIREALVDMGSDHAINYPVTITVMEEEQ